MVMVRGPETTKEMHGSVEWHWQPAHTPGCERAKLMWVAPGVRGGEREKQQPTIYIVTYNYK
jgi:hypothetical protein